MRPIYAIDHQHDLPFGELVSMLGRTGATLADISVNLGLPVPPGFTVTTAACRDFLATGEYEEAGLDDTRTATRALARDDGLPLLVSVRPSTPTAMPPNRLTATITILAIASPLTNFIAPTIEP